MTEHLCSQCSTLHDPQGRCSRAVPATTQGNGRTLGVAALVACGVLLVGGYVFSGPTDEEPASSPSPTSTIVVTPAAGLNTIAGEQTPADPTLVAGTVAHLLAANQQQDAHRDQALDCRRTGLENARRDLQGTTTRREQLLSQARNLNIQALPSGAALAVSLRSGLAHSLAADKQFRSWARTRYAGGPCNTWSAHYRAGQAQITRAEQDVRRVAELWRPVARQYRLPALTPPG